MDENNSVLPNSPSSKLRKIIYLLIALSVLLATVLALFIFLQREKQSITGTGKSNEVEEVASDEDIENLASEIIGYVDTQARPDGFYEYYAHFDDVCAKEGNCPFGQTRMFETTNAWAALGHFAEYSFTRDSGVLEKATEDIRVMAEWCEDNRQTCNWVLVQPSIINATVNSPVINEFVNSQGEFLLNSEASASPMLAAIEARELAMIYKATGDVRYKTEAEARNKIASNLLQSSDQSAYADSEIRFASGSCWVALSWLEQEDISSQELENIKIFIGNGMLKENFLQILAPSEVQPCIEAYIQHYKLSGEESSLQEAKALMGLLIEHYYDGPERSFVFGEGGTKFSLLEDDKTGKNVVTLTDSAYTLYLLSLLNEYEK